MSKIGDPLSSSFNEADLHGLVDGRVDASRQADLSRRLKSHPADRARVEAWREQNELIRATFSDVEGETIPVSLRLAPAPRLRCVASEGSALDPRKTPMGVGPGATGKPKTRSRLLALALVVGCIGLVSSWFTLDRPGSNLGSTSPSANRGNKTLASRTLDALATTPRLLSVSGPDQTGKLARDLPTVTIPDLSDAGFSFTGAVAQPADPAAILLFYANGKADRLVIGVTKASAADQSDTVLPVQSGRAVTWRRHERSFAISGTLDTRRLADLAMSLQADEHPY